MARLNDLQILITAEEGYAAFERAVVAARSRIDMGFRVFDARTALISDEARAIGTTWIDLLVAKLNEGVDITIRISDFDPIVRPKLHQDSHKSLSVLMGVAELAKGSGTLRASVDAHPARIGWAPRMALWPKVQSQISQTCDWLNDLGQSERKEALRCMPRVPDFTVEKDGLIYPKRSEFPSMLPVTHHQKIAVIDDEVLYVGGLDLSERRFDTKDHDRPTDETWHDIHICLTDATLALEARAHLERFREECAGEHPVQPPKTLLRTLSVKRGTYGNGLAPVVSDTGIMDRTLERISQSQRLIYLENQFLRDPVIADALCAQAQKEPGLGLIILLPGAPLEVAFEGQSSLDQKYGEYLQATALRQLEAAFGDRVLFTSPARPRKLAENGRFNLLGAPMVFVHSKVSVFDDTAGLVTSANLNGRSMRWDTECGIEIDAPEQVKMLRERIMKAWLPDDVDDSYCASRAQTVGLWRRLAEENAAAAPSDRRGFLLPYVVQEAESFGTNLPGIPVEMV